MEPIRVIDATKPRQCEDCGRVADCRPYGPGYSWVCFGCVLKDEDGAVRRYRALLNGGEVVHVVIKDPKTGP